MSADLDHPLPFDRTPETVVRTRAQVRFADWSIDILIYTIVLNVFEEHVHGVVIESFTLSVLTAVLMKVVLVLLSGVEERAHHYFWRKGTVAWKAVGVVVIWTILIGGKLLILELVDLVFGDEVELGHFVEVIFLVVTMMIASRFLHAIFERLGPTEPAESPSVRPAPRGR